MKMGQKNPPLIKRALWASGQKGQVLESPPLHVPAVNCGLSSTKGRSGSVFHMLQAPIHLFLVRAVLNHGTFAQNNFGMLTYIDILTLY